MADPTTVPAPPPCQIPSPFEEDIKKLNDELKQQDTEDKKTQLAEVVKINDDVVKTETSYEKDYPGLQFKEAQSAVYKTNREAQLSLTPQEKEKIKWIVGCFETVEALKQKWIAARSALPALQMAFQQAQDNAADKDAAYKDAQDYKSNQNELDALQAQSTKEFDAGNKRGTYFLLKHEMEPRLTPPKPPNEYNDYLKQKATDVRAARESLRQAKIKLDDATAAAQAAKKAFEEAKTKRRENILKRIAEETFPAAAAAAAGAPGSSPAPPEAPGSPTGSTGV